MVPVRNLVLYQLYLTQPKTIYRIKNSNQIFLNIYFELHEEPSKIDRKIHDLLTCFTEIDPNKKLEILTASKKQELLMIDANFVCLKLASTHPFIFIRYLPMMEGILQGRVIYTYDDFKKRKTEKLFHYVVDLMNILIPYIFKIDYSQTFETIISHYFDIFKSYSLDNFELGSLVVKFMDLMEKFIHYDIQRASKVLNKYKQLITTLQKTYSDVASLKYLNNLTLLSLQLSIDSNANQDGFYIPKPTSRLWSQKQLEPFINKLLNRDNFDGVITVLQELDTISQRQSILLMYFVDYFHQLLIDPNDVIRDLAFSLTMRFLRLNTRESYSFFDVYCKCLNHENSTIFKSALKIFPDFTLLCSEKSQCLLKYAFMGCVRHNIDACKQIADAIRILNLEKYVY